MAAAKLVAFWEWTALAGVAFLAKVLVDELVQIRVMDRSHLSWAVFGMALAGGLRPPRLVGLLPYAIMLTSFVAMVLQIEDKYFPSNLNVKKFKHDIAKIFNYATYVTALLLCRMLIEVLPIEIWSYILRTLSCRATSSWRLVMKPTGRREEILVTYKPTPAPFGLSDVAAVPELTCLNREQLQCLAPSTDLSPEVVSLFMRLLQARDLRNRLCWWHRAAPRCHFFSGTFFSQLVRPGSSGAKIYDYANVRGITCGPRLAGMQQASSSVLLTDELFFPVHAWGRWSLVAISVLDRSAIFYDLRRMEVQDDRDRSQDPRVHVLQLLLQWVADEAYDKLYCRWDTSTWQRRVVQLQACERSDDCGLHMLALAERLAAGRPAAPPPTGRWSRGGGRSGISAMCGSLTRTEGGEGDRGLVMRQELMHRLLRLRV